MSARPLNFLQPDPGPWIGNALLIAGAFALIGAIWVADEWALEKTRVEESIRVHQEAQRIERQVAAKPAAPSQADLRYQRVSSERARPWVAALRAIEAATADPVYLKSLLIDAGTGQIKLEAEGPSFEHALAFTQVLADGATLPSATLASHEVTLDLARSAPSVRFTVLSQWRRE